MYRKTDSGAVLRTLKTPYAEALRTGPVNEEEAIRLALRRQHQRVVDDLTSGLMSIDA